MRWRCTSSRLGQELEISIRCGAAVAAELVGSLQFSHSEAAALAPDFIRSSKFQSPGDCAGSRLGQQLDFFVIRGTCTRSPLDQGFQVSIIWGLSGQPTWLGVCIFHHPGGAALAANLIMSSEFHSSRDCDGCRLDQELEM